MAKILLATVMCTVAIIGAKEAINFYNWANGYTTTITDKDSGLVCYINYAPAPVMDCIK